jgi:hypothetical protein
MSKEVVKSKRELRAIVDLSETVSDVDSSLTAICELLQAANGAKVNACGIHALLQPLQVRLSEAASELNDYPAAPGLVELVSMT